MNAEVEHLVSQRATQNGFHLMIACIDAANSYARSAVHTNQKRLC